MSAHNDILRLRLKLARLGKDAEQHDRGNKAAGTRLRKGLQALKADAQALRVSVLADRQAKNEREEHDRIEQHRLDLARVMAEEKRLREEHPDYCHRFASLEIDDEPPSYPTEAMLEREKTRAAEGKLTMAEAKRRTKARVLRQLAEPGLAEALGFDPTDKEAFESAMGNMADSSNADR
jgi:hypothetical protein